MGPTEQIRVPEEIADRIGVIVKMRRLDGSAQLLDPFLEPWVTSRFESIPERVATMVRYGRDASRVWFENRAGGEETGKTVPVRVGWWTAWRLAIIAAVERVRIGPLLAPVLTTWVNQQYLDAVRAEEAKIRRTGVADAAPPETGDQPPAAGAQAPHPPTKPRTSKTRR